MNYSKKFFIALATFCGTLAVFTGWFLGKGALPVALIGVLTVGVVGATLVGRVSNSLAEQAARLFGKAMFSLPAKTLARLLLRRDIQTIETTKASSGDKEIGYEEFSYDRVLKRLEECGIIPDMLQIDMAGFRGYLQAARYREHYPGYYEDAPEYLAHKQIQHYLSTMLTSIQGSEVWMDVASANSPFPDILTRLYGITVYRQDLGYPPGVRGLFVGSNAAAIPLPDESIDRISLHCSFEHFEKDSDSSFLRELTRLLRPGGVACIIPLYVSNRYQILTNPRYWLPRGVPKENGAQITISRTYWESHGRFYDAAALEKRVIAPLRMVQLKYRLIQVQVPPEINYPPFVILEIRKP